MGVMMKLMLRNAQCYYQITKRLACGKRLFHSSIMCNSSVVNHREDRFGGVHVSLSGWTQSAASFGSVLVESILKWKEAGHPAVWIDVPIACAHFIPVLAQQGFVYHHAEGDTAVLCQWIDDKNTSLLPRYATHQVGVSGCVVDEDTKQVLVIKDKHRKATFWKFPGGLSDLGEDIGVTAEREIFEETGIKTKFQGILTFRQQHDLSAAFGRSDLYFVCHMTPVTFDIHPCAREIEACMWMDIDSLAENGEIPALILRVLTLVKRGIAEGFDNVTLHGEEYKSVFKGKKYKLFSTPMDKLTDHYAHDLTDDSVMKSPSKSS